MKIQGMTVGRECRICEKIRNDAAYAKVKAARDAAKPRPSGD